MVDRRLELPICLDCCRSTRLWLDDWIFPFRRTVRVISHRKSNFLEVAPADTWRSECGCTAAECCCSAAHRWKGVLLLVACARVFASCPRLRVLGQAGRISRAFAHGNEKSAGFHASADLFLKYRCHGLPSVIHG